MTKYAIIVAGGNGTRMNTKLPKQFIEIAGKPLLMHTIQRFYDADSSTIIVVVLPKAYMKKWKALAKKFFINVMYFIVPGGDTRFESVQKGLKEVTEKSIVAVHDGVRPLASKKLINRCFSEAEKYGSAVPVVSLNESLRKISGKRSEVVDRSSYSIIQTPQCFRSEIILKAYQQRFKESFTDDATVVESIGEKIHLIEGERENIKITFPSDLRIAELYLKE